MNCFKMLLMLIPVLLIRCSAPEDQTPPEPSASTEAVQKKEEMKPDVRNVRWGMTAEEIRANEKLPLKQSGTDSPHLKVLSSGMTTILGHPHTSLVYRLFKADDEFYRLREIWLGFISPTQKKAVYVVSILREKYGRPTVDKDYNRLIWKTDDERTYIEVSELPETEGVLRLKYIDWQMHRKQDMDDL